MAIRIRQLGDMNNVTLRAVDAPVHFDRSVHVEWVHIMFDGDIWITVTEAFEIGPMSDGGPGTWVRAGGK